MSARFKDAVHKSVPIRTAFKPGLQALKATDKERVEASRPRKLTGSVDLDAALKSDLPRDPRWDYGVGYSPQGSTRDFVHWIEVHPCNDGEIDAIKAKLRWLDGWLTHHAKALRSLPCQYVWVSSGPTRITPKSPQSRSLAQLGIELAGSRYKID